MTDLDALEAVLAKARIPGKCRVYSEPAVGLGPDIFVDHALYPYAAYPIGLEREVVLEAVAATLNTTPTLIAEHRALLAENTALRSALANSPGACVYCQLPANEMSRCASGFPGCGRADDMQGCPHFGTAEIPEDIQEQHVALLARVEELEAEVVRLRGPATEFARGYGPGDGDSAALEPKP